MIFGIGVVAHPGRPGPGLAGVVDEDVEVAVGGGDGGFGGEDAGFGGDVEEDAGVKLMIESSMAKGVNVRNQRASPSELFGTLPHDILPAPTDVYLRAVRSQPLGNHETDTCVAACHECDAVRHVE